MIVCVLRSDNFCYDSVYNFYITVQYCTIITNQNIVFVQQQQFWCCVQFLSKLKSLIIFSCIK